MIHTLFILVVVYGHTNAKNVSSQEELKDSILILSERSTPVRISMKDHCTCCLHLGIQISTNFTELYELDFIVIDQEVFCKSLIFFLICRHLEITIHLISHY